MKTLCEPGSHRALVGIVDVHPVAIRTEVVGDIHSEPVGLAEAVSWHPDPHLIVGVVHEVAGSGASPYCLSGEVSQRHAARAMTRAPR